MTRPRQTISACSATVSAPVPPNWTAAYETICERCRFFHTTIEFRPTLQRQGEHAGNNHQHHRADLFDRLLTGIDEAAS